MKRRDLLAQGTVALGSLMLAGTFARAEEAEPCEDFVWNYESLDPVATAERAYTLYADGSCMYASFRALVEGVGFIRREKDPREASHYDQFPYYMMFYGRGGVHDYGTLCGILNGCAAAISLFVRDRKDAAAMTRELFSWYETAELPVFVPSQTKHGEIERSIAESPLCHISVSHWLQESGAEVESPRRKERCKRLVCDGVVKTVELLNLYFQSRQNNVVCAFAASAEPAASCTACHSPQGDAKDCNTQMNCGICHEEVVQACDEKTHPAGGLTRGPRTGKDQLSFLSRTGETISISELDL
ncbi:MAG: C-GCAxxG-C-C family protein [Planctomycetia bacterium]|nr:C-GCAxxG-C-C family protein [Planctomycetia bacterium]